MAEIRSHTPITLYRKTVRNLNRILVGKPVKILKWNRSKKKDGDKMLKYNYSCPCKSHEGRGGNGGIAPLTTTLGTRRWAIRITSQTLYPRRKSPWWPIEWEAGWAPQPLQTSCRREKPFAPLWKSNHNSSSVQHVAYSLHWPRHLQLRTNLYRGADKPLARPGRKQATATEDFELHISYL